MNWYKKSQLVSTKSLEWDRIFSELQRELGREPTAEEIQQRLHDKYWTKQPAPEQMSLPFG